MKRTLFFMLLSALLLGGAATAQAEIYSGECGAEGDNLTWTLDTQTGVLAISGTGAMSNTMPPWYYYRTSITSVTIDDRITTIGNAAFYYCTGLTSVTIGSSVITIGSSAFSGCTGLTEVTIPNSVTTIGDYAFSGCSGLHEVTIGEGVTIIGNYTFSDCTGLKNLRIEDGTETLELSTLSSSLTPFSDCPLDTVYLGRNISYSNNSSPFKDKTSLVSLTIGNQVTSIGEYAFSGCSGLTEVTIPNSITSIDTYAFAGCTGLTEVAIPESVTTISDYTFSGCTGLTEVAIPESVTAIGSSAFSGCTGLTSVTIPNSVTTIGSSVFSGCTGLTSVTIPNNVTTISDYTFSGCTGLHEVTIGKSVTTIGDHAFSGCTGLTEVTIPNSVITIGSSAFYRCSDLSSVTIPESVITIGSSAFYRCTGLTSVTIPESVTSIGESAFEYCTGLTEVTIPNSVTSIDTYAFAGCTGLTEVAIPESVTAIGSSAFSGCTGLTEVTIPNSVITIGSSAFYRCSDLSSVTIPESVTSIGESAFEYCTGLTSVTIPNSVTTIGGRTFSGCTELKNLRIEDGSETLAINISSYYTSFYNCPLDTVYLGRNVDFTYERENDTYYNSLFMDKTNLVSLTIGSQVTAIGDGAFDGCTGLTSVTIPEGVTSIDGRAFSGCTGLKNLQIEDGTETLALNSSFDDCPLDTIYLGRNISYESSPFKDKTSLVSLTIGNRVMTISYSAFSGCTGLTEVTIPESVTTIESETFSGCTGLTSVTIPNSVTTIGDHTFFGCTELKNLRIEDGTETLSLSTSSFDACPLDTVYLGRNIDYSSGYNTYYNSPFEDKTNLVSLTIGNQVTSIGSNAFYGCEGLTSVTIPNSVTTIDRRAFYRCSGLTSVTIPESVDSIGNYAFSDCKNLQEITPLGTIPPSINDNTFDQYIYQNATVNYPKGSLHIYKNADGWKNFTYPSVQTILDLQIDSNIGETTGRITISYTPDMEYPVRGFSFCMGEEQFTFDSTQTVIPLTFADLDPETRYEAKFIIETVYGEQVVTPITFTTNAVRLTAQPAKNTDVKATLEAEVECDAETGYGFEWRRHGAPDNVPPARVEAYNIDGKIAGTLRNLTPNTYYEFRPYYRSASGKYYYGSYAGKDNWIGFGTFDYGVEWDPAVNTCTSEIHGNNSTISAYVVEGSDELLSQGFEYWAERAETPVSRSTASNPERIEGSGSLMSVTLTGLDYNTTYYYRAYATTAKKTTYGNTESFTTGEDPNLSGIEETEAAANAEFEVRLSGNPVRNGEIGVQVVGADGATWYRVISLHGSLITQGVLSGTDEWQPVKIPAASTGYYLLQIIGSKGTKTLRIVVE